MGHYTALCHNALTGTWHCFDDSAVREVQDSSVQSPNAYLLVYSRKPFQKPKINGLWCVQPKGQIHYGNKYKSTLLLYSDNSCFPVGFFILFVLHHYSPMFVSNVHLLYCLVKLQGEERFIQPITTLRTSEHSQTLIWSSFNKYLWVFGG